MVKIIKLEQNRNLTEASILDEQRAGCYIQLYHNQVGYCVRVVTPTLSEWICRNVKRLSTVNNRVARYNIRFEPEAPYER